MSKPLYGLIGYPVKHSLSPSMHNAALAALGLPGEYRLFEVAPADLQQFFATCETQGVRGLNVTVPHKEAVLAFVELTHDSFYARASNAVNTIVFCDGTRRGFNTDIPGFTRHLQELGVDAAGKRAALIGAGGAGKAVAYALAQAQAATITVCDIDAEKRNATVRMVREGMGYDRITAVGSVEELAVAEKDILVNATPVGMQSSDPCLIDEKLLHKGLFVYDLIYNPAQTELLARAERAGAAFSNGLGMLLYQGALAFQHFTGHEAPIAVMKKALIEALERR